MQVSVPKAQNVETLILTSKGLLSYLVVPRRVGIASMKINPIYKKFVGEEKFSALQGSS